MTNDLITFGNIPRNYPSPVAGGKIDSSVYSYLCVMHYSRLNLGRSTVVKHKLYSCIILG